VGEIISNKLFEKEDFTINPLSKGEYEHCTFNSCDFSNSNLSNIVFSDCTFNACNLALANLNKTAFREVKFKDCKLLGLHFENCNDFLFSVGFENCLLNLSSFYKLKIKKTVFINCKINEVDFSESDLSSSVFDNCDLSGSTFENTNLEKVDFTSSFNFDIHPEKNKLKKTRFSAQNVVGLLSHLDVIIV